MKKILLFIMLASPLLASGTKHSFSDPLMNDELDNVYHEIDSTFRNKVYKSTITLTSIAVTSMTVTHIYGPFTNWATYTPAFSAGWGTVSNKNFFWRRVGDTLEVHGTFTTGAITASSGTISLPSGLAVDSTKLTGSAKDFAGICWDLEPGGSSTNHLRFLYWAGSINEVVLNDGAPGTDAFSASNVNGTFASAIGATAEFKLPITGWSF